MAAEPNPPGEPSAAVRAALVELSAALVIAQPIIVTAADWWGGTGTYRPDAYERRELGQHIERWAAWEQTHHQLAKWAARNGARAAAGALRLVT